MERMNGESYISYAKRVIKAKEENLVSYSEMGDLLLGEDNNYSRDNIRKFYYIAKKMFDKIDDSVVVTDEDVLKEIEQAKEELFKERVRLQDKKREYNKTLREDARFERLIEVLKENVVPIKGLEFSPINFQNYCKTATLLLSDLHIGLEVDNQVNFFNKNVAIDRLKQVVEKTIEIGIKNDVKKLNIDLCGDLISGIINISHRVEQEEDIITQITSCSEILSTVIMELDVYFDVVVHGVIGNHSRAFASKKEGLPRENFERLIFEYIKIKCPSIEFVDGRYSDYLVYDVNDETVVISHGDKDSLSNATTHFTNVLGYKPNHILLGHIHHTNLKDDCNTNIIVNGSLIGADDYAISLRRNTKPSQTLIIFGEDLGIYKLSLK